MGRTWETMSVTAAFPLPSAGPGPRGGEPLPIAVITCILSDGVGAAGERGATVTTILSHDAGVHALEPTGIGPAGQVAQDAGTGAVFLYTEALSGAGGLASTCLDLMRRGAGASVRASGGAP